MSAPNSFLRPRALRPGARVALVAPGGFLDPERIDRSVERCRRLGLEPALAPSAAARHRYLAGTDDQRRADLQRAFDDPSIDGVWALRGGYGTQRILDDLDLTRQRRAPVPFIGFSDNTTLLVRHSAMGVVAFHGPHPGTTGADEIERWFHIMLFVTEPAGVLPSPEGAPTPRTLVAGEVEARLFGGNLSMLASLCGTRDSPEARGRILFLEDVGEPAYRVDRMLVQLRRSGALDDVAGLAVGRFTDSPDEDGEGVAAVIEEFARELAVPAVADLPFGHVDDNCVLPVGALARLDAGDARLSILEAAVGDP